MTPLFFFHSFIYRGLFSTQRKKRESCDYWLLTTTMHFRPLVVWKRFFFCLLLRSKKKVKDTHFNTPTTNKKKKVYNTTTRNASLSPSLSLSLSPLESAVLIKGARKSTTVVVLSCFCENTTASTQRTYTVMWVSFFLCAFVHPTRLHKRLSSVF